MLQQVAQPEARGVRHDELLDPGEAHPLLKLLKQVDVLLVNDSEVRELSGDWHIHRAARWVLEHGPRWWW